MSKKWKTTVQPADRNPEIEVIVEYDYHKGSPGRLWGPPERCYPPEPAYVEIINVMHGAIDIEQYLSDEAMTTIEWDIEQAEIAERDYQEGQHADMCRDDARNIEYWEAREQ